MVHSLPYAGCGAKLDRDGIRWRFAFENRPIAFGAPDTSTTEVAPTGVGASGNCSLIERRNAGGRFRVSATTCGAVSAYLPPT